MEENKNLTPDESTNDIVEENFNIEEAVKADKGGKKPKKTSKKEPKEKVKKVRNQAFLKRGSYSLAITAIVIVGIIIFNVLISVLAVRFVLEFDMTTEKEFSISQENIDFIKSVEDEVNVIICATEDEYKGEYMAYFAQQYGVTSNSTPYHIQTVNLINRYQDYNRKIKVQFMDTQSTEFASVASKYSNSSLAFGDIIVEATKNNNTRHKIVKYTDIYNIYQDQSYYSGGSISSNDIETALTSAIAYVLSSETKKVGILTGHSSVDLTEDYIDLLETNNYVTEVVEDALITSVSEDFDALVIAAPTIDFSGTELDAIAKFLENDGKLNKGLVVFYSSASPYLPNLSDFLAEWGIGVDEGILFETDSSYHIPSQPTALASLPITLEDDSITSDLTMCISGNNVPLKALYEKEGYVTVTPLLTTSENVVAAPIGIDAGWNGAGDYEKQAFYTAIQAKKWTYDDDNEEIAAHVFVFSSIDFISSDYNEQYNISNKDITLSAAERAAIAESGGISFISKQITNEYFTPSASSSGIILIIFVIVLPIAMLITAIIVYIKRRNA